MHSTVRTYLAQMGFSLNESDSYCLYKILVDKRLFEVSFEGQSNNSSLVLIVLRANFQINYLKNGRVNVYLKGLSRILKKEGVLLSFKGSKLDLCFQIDTTLFTDEEYEENLQYVNDILLRNLQLLYSVLQIMEVGYAADRVPRSRSYEKILPTNLIDLTLCRCIDDNAVN